jgi:hypothetical protein
MNGHQPSIAILIHWTDDFFRRRYLLHLLMSRWQAQGFKVFVRNDREPFIPADLAFLHVDLSLVPDSLRQLASRYPRVINGNSLDNRKRSFSQLILGLDGPDSGPVIIKTDCNCGAAQEVRARLLQSRFGKLIRGLGLDRFLMRRIVSFEALRSWSRRRIIPVGDYPVFASRAHVPTGVWRNPHLLVERFRSERDGPYYCCRHWLFFGQSEVTRRTRSLDPVVKGDAGIEPTRDVVPEALRALRSKLGFDYGKFDYAIIHGEVILYDANRTPGAMSDPSLHGGTVEVLAPGIRGFSDCPVQN